MTLQVGWVSLRRKEKIHKDFTTEVVVENINNEIKILPVTRTQRMTPANPGLVRTEMYGHYPALRKRTGGTHFSFIHKG